MIKGNLMYFIILIADCQFYLCADSIRKMDLRAVFINNLKRYRKENKLSQMALAEKCGTSASYIGEIEIGKKFPSVEMVQKFADALNIKPYKLFMEENDIYVANLSPQKRQRLVEKLQESVEEIISRTGDFV